MAALCYARYLTKRHITSWQRHGMRGCLFKILRGHRKTLIKAASITPTTRDRRAFIMSSRIFLNADSFVGFSQYCMFRNICKYLVLLISMYSIVVVTLVLQAGRPIGSNLDRTSIHKVLK